jgi:hypothetical protein
MASFTDNPQALGTFNPYVQQLPVEAMVKVGMQKQEQYNQGIQKIQTSIDNIAGLDIARDSDKAYLQSKVNELGNNLKFVAAGDFSDFQLVNSVNGMTGQLVKDPNVQNAVTSTTKLRAGYKKREELEKKGLTDKNNDDYYNKFVSDYLDDNKLDASFNADYVPYTNIIKKLQDALKESGESTTIAEQIFVTGSDGKPLITNGHYTYADAKTINKLVSNKPAVIAAINNVLNEGSVKQQMGIDGWATYRNTDATTLLEPLKIQYDDQKSKLQQQSVEITAMLNSTNLTAEQKEMYTKASSEIEANLLQNDNMFTTLSQEAESNPESFKQNYYTQEFKQRLLTQFVKEEDSKTYGTNEALQQQNWRDTKAFNELVERNKIAYQNETLKISQSGNQRAWMEFYRDSVQDPVTGNWNKKPEPGKKGTAGTFDANKPLFTGGTPGGKVDAQNIIETDINFLSAEKNKMSFSLYADFIRTNKNDPSVSDADILAQVNVYAKQKGITSEAYLDRWAKNIKNKYDENGLTPPPNLDDDFTAYNNTAFSLNNKMNQVKTASDSSKKEAGVDKEINELLKNKVTFNFNANGEKFNITPEDMLKMIKSGWINKLATNYAISNPRFIVRDENLTTKQNKFLSNWYKLAPEMREQVLKEAGNYSNVSKYYTALEKSDKIYNEKLAKIVGVSDVVTGFLPIDTEGKPETIAKVATYLNSGGERNFEAGSDKQKALDALDNATAVTWRGKKPTNSREDWVGEIIITGPKGTSPVTITNVNRADLETFTDATFTSYEEKPIQDAINMNEKTKSTNPVHMPNSPTAWTTAHYNGGQVNPEVTRQGWSYRADVVKSGGGYRLVNYIRPPGGKEFITVYGAAIATDERIIDNTYKTTTPVQLNAMYLNYLQKTK